MKKKQKDEYSLSRELLNGASEYIKQKAFKKNSPIVIMEDGKLYLLDKNNKKTKIENSYGDIKK